MIHEVNNSKLFLKSPSVVVPTFSNSDSKSANFNVFGGK